LVHQKIPKKKIEVYKTPIEKATSLLNTLEQKNFGKKEKLKNIIVIDRYCPKLYRRGD
jgi:hypothetical protein